MRRILLAVTFLVGLRLEPVVAQRPAATQGSVPASIAAGLLLGGVGLVAGTLVGFSVFDVCFADCSDSDDQEVLATMLLGESLGMALGVHLGNRRLGSFPLDVIAAALTGGAGLLMADADRAWTVVAIPVAQLVTTVVTERAVGQSRARRRVSLSVIPSGQNRAALGARVGF